MKTKKAPTRNETRQVFTWTWLLKMPRGESAITKGPVSSARMKAWMHGFRITVQRLPHGRNLITKI